MGLHVPILTSGDSLRKLLQDRPEKEVTLGEHAGIEKPVKEQSVAQKVHRYQTHELKISLPVINNFT